MRKIISHLHISLDGFASGLKGEIDWIKLDSEMFDLVKTLTDYSDTALYGRMTWQLMDGYWPTAADKSNATKHDKEHSAWYNSVDKVVISNTMKGQNLNQTTLIGGDVTGAVKKLKEYNGKDILIFGSPSVVRLLMKENLIDEYWLFVNPVILGQGISMFTEMDNKIVLTREEIKAFSCGVTALQYTT